MKNIILSIAFILVSILVVSGQGIFDPNIHTATPFGIVDSPINESAQQVIDQDPQTKFLDFIITDGIGFEVDLLGEAVIATSMEFVTANDAPERDPVSYQIWGAEDGVTFDSITSGEIPCVDDRFLARTITFENAIAYSAYRFVFSGVCSPTNINQIADVQLYAAVGSVPSFNCPPDVTVDNDLGLCSALYEYTISVNDEEDGALTPTFESGIESGEMFPVGSTSVIYSAIDSDGNKASCSFNVVVLDNEPPACFDDIVVTIPVGQTSAVVEFDLSSLDNCTVIDTIPNFIPLVTLEGESYYISNTFFFPQDAFFDAVASGGWLGTIRNEAYNTTINTALKNFVGNFEVLNGLNDINEEGVFTWQNQDPSTYRNWQENEPNDANDNEDYVIMKPNGEWNDVSGGENQFPYLMQKTYNPPPVLGQASGETFDLGTTTNSFQVYDIYGNLTTCTFDVIVQTSTNVTESELEQITIAPNPSSETVFLNIGSNVHIDRITLYDSFGKKLKDFKENDFLKEKVINISDLSNGTYFIMISNSQEQVMKRIIKI